MFYNILNVGDVGIRASVCVPGAPVLRLFCVYGNDIILRS